MVAPSSQAVVRVTILYSSCRGKSFVLSHNPTLSPEPWPSWTSVQGQRWEWVGAGPDHLVQTASSQCSLASPRRWLWGCSRPQCVCLPATDTIAARPAVRAGRECVLLLLLLCDEHTQPSKP